MTANFTAAWRIMLARVRASGLVLTTAITTILLAITLLAAGPIYASAVYLASLHRTVSDAPTTEANLEVTATLRPDAYAAADAVVTDEIVRTFGGRGVEVYRTGVSESHALPHPEGVQITDLTVFQFFDNLDQHATLVEGEWPADQGGTSTVNVAIPEGAAQTLGISLGDEVPLTNRIDETTVVTARIGGIYRPDDPLDPYWYGSELEVAGAEEGSSFNRYGPFVVAEETFLRVFTTRAASISWRAVPRIEELTVADVPLIRRALPGLEGRIEGVVDVDARITGSIELSQLLGRVERSLLATRSGVLILTIQLAILAGYALVLSAGLLVDQRRTETALLRSRGAGVRQVLALALMEGLLLTVPAVLVGPYLATWLLRLLNVTGPLAGIGMTLDPRVSSGAYLLAALAGIASVVTLVLPAAFSARSIIEEQAGRGRQRTRSVFQRGAVDMTLLAVAGIAFYQLRRYGAPLTESVRGRLEVDPLLVAAPAIGLLAGAVIALRLVPLLASAAERLTARRGRTITALSAFQVARRPLRYARSALLLMLALAIGLFTVSYATTWRVSQADQADFQVGADVRVSPNQRPSGIPREVVTSAYHTLDGVEAVMPVSETFRAIGRSRDTADIVLIDADRAAEIVRIRDDLAAEPFATMLGRLASARPEIATVPIPGEPRRLAIDVRGMLVEADDISALDSADIVFVPSVVIRDGDGLVHRISGEQLRMDDELERATFSFTRPMADGTMLGMTYPLEIVAVEIGTNAHLYHQPGVLELRGLLVDSSAGGDEWTPVEANLGVAFWEMDASGEADGVSGVPRVETLSAAEVEPGTIGFSFAFGSSWQFSNTVHLRFRPAGELTPREIPVLVSRHLMEQLAFEIGDEFTLVLRGNGQRLAIAGVLDAFPTLDEEASQFVIIDWATLATYDLEAPGLPLSTPSEYWLAVEPGQAEAVAETLREVPFRSALVEPRHERAQVLRTDPVALGMIGALTIGFVAAIVFALIGFVTSAAVSVRERLTEFALLRAIGLSPRQLAGWLLLEHGFLLLVSLVFGTALGLLLSWVVLPQITVTQDATIAFPAVEIVIPWATITLLEAAAIATLVVVSGLLALLLRRIGLGALLRIGEDA